MDSNAPLSSRRQRGLKAFRRGLRAEAWCRLILALKLYRLVAQRYKTNVGEIDLIAARGRTIAFIEVKARANQETAAAAISPHQQERMRRAASAFIARHPRYAAFHQRFDAMLIAPGRWPRHIENAFDTHPQFF